MSCLARGLYVPTDELDHVIPLHRGGLDHDDNMQGLCAPCHLAKTAEEEGFRVSNHPDWLAPSRIPLTIITGPPCSGKSTLVRMSAGPRDLTVDLDDLLLELDPAYRPWSGDRTNLDAAIRARNRLLGSLSLEGCHYPHAWFIVAAPTQAERTWWQGKLGGEVQLLNPGTAECIRRAKARGTPGAIEAVHDWDRRSRLPWVPHRTKARIAEDGWPET